MSKGKGSASMGGPDDDGLTKAKLDDTELSNELPKALQKVELDLDDAPFLEDEKEEAPPEPAGEEPAQAAEEVAPRPWWKKKVVLFGGAGLLLLILAAVAYFLFFSGKKAEAPPTSPAAEAPQEEGHGATDGATAPPPLEQSHTVVLDPFLVEQTNDKGEVFLVTLQISTATTDPDLEKELDKNAIVIRDSVYYFLKNKQLILLDDEKTAEALKKDIMSVINQFLGDARIENLYIEKYLVK